MADSHDGLTRLRFHDGQRLTRRDLELEQSYHLDQHRRHAISHHTWGIALGLELTLDQGSVWVEPGVAVDGYGRTVTLAERRALTITELHAPAIDVELLYDRRAGSLGGGNHDENGRWIERSRLICVPVDDPRRPIRPVPCDAPADPEVRAAQPLCDDPALRWPVHLGRLLRGDDGSWVAIDPRQRVEAGLLGGHLEHPADPEGMRIALEPGRGCCGEGDGSHGGDHDQGSHGQSSHGQGSHGGRLAIYPSRRHQLDDDPCVTVDGDALIVKGDVEVEGDLDVRRSVDFALPVPAQEGVGSLRRTRQEQATAEDFTLRRSPEEPSELRLALPSESGSPARFVVGTWTDVDGGPPALAAGGGTPEDDTAASEDGNTGDDTEGLVFRPILVVWNDGRVEVKGDLSIDGRIARMPQNAGSPPPDEGADVGPDLILSNYAEGMSGEVLPLPLMRALAIQLATYPEKLLVFIELLLAALANNPAAWQDAVKPDNLPVTNAILCQIKTDLETVGYKDWADPCAAIVPPPDSGDAS